MKKGTPNKKTISDTIPTLASQTETPLSPFAEFIKKWILFRIPTIFAWMWFIWKVFGIELPVEQRFESYLVIPYLVVFGIFVITIHWNLAFGYPFYFIFSPLLLIIEPVLFIIKTYRSSSDELSTWSKGLGKFFVFLRSYKFIIILALLSMSGWTAMAFYVSPTNRPFLALASHIITYLLFLQSFRWAANPYKPILLGLSLASKIVERALRGIFIEPSLKKKREERVSGYTACLWVLSGIERLKPYGTVNEGITSITHGKLSAIFTSFFFFMYFLIATSFAMSLYEIEYGWVKILEGLGEAPDRMAYFYFSFLSQATAIPDGVQPLNHLGRLWIMWLVVTGLSLLTGLITLFTSSAEVYSESTLAEVKRLFQEMVEKVNACKTELDEGPEPT